MEMEHINDNTIRVLIKSEDLAARGITFLDLLGNHNEIENFFYSILEEVDIDEEFKGSEAVTFQVLPKGDGLELFISKNLPQDSMEDFDEFNENPEDDLSDILKRHVASQLQEQESNQTTYGTSAGYVFELKDFEQMVQLAFAVHLESAITNLYRMNDSYFLEVQFLDEQTSDDTIENALAYIMEFSRRTPVTSEVLAEYGQLVMEHDALELTRYYFKD